MPGLRGAGLVAPGVREREEVWARLLGLGWGSCRWGGLRGELAADEVYC